MMDWPLWRARRRRKLPKLPQAIYSRSPGLNLRTWPMRYYFWPRIRRALLPAHNSCSMPGCSRGDSNSVSNATPTPLSACHLQIPGLAPSLNPQPSTLNQKMTPTATYRLQMKMGFEQAISILDYLKELGISHGYLSPIFTARPG